MRKGFVFLLAVAGCMLVLCVVMPRKNFEKKLLIAPKTTEVLSKIPQNSAVQRVEKSAKVSVLPKPRPYFFLRQA